MNKKILILSLALVLAISLFAIGCGSEEETTTTTAAPAETTTTAAAGETTTTAAPAETTTTAGEPQEVINLTFNDHNPPENAMAQGLQAYAKYIEDNSGGRVKIDVQLGGALYGNQEIFDGVRTGGADAGTYVIETGDGFYYANATALPFMTYAGTEDAVATYWELYDAFPEIAKEFEDLGLVYGAHFAMPPVHVHWHDANVVVTTPDDLKGKSLLALEGYVAEWFKMLGASTENPTFQDLFSMIDNRSADGYIQHFNFLGGFDLIKEYQSHTLFGDSGVLMMNLGVIWNKDTWDSLPADIQQIAIDAREVYVQTGNEVSEKDAEIFMAQVEELNHTATVLTAEQMKPWQEKLATVYDKWVADAPDPAVGQQIYDKLVELVAQ